MHQDTSTPRIVPAAAALQITRLRGDEDREPDRRPLDFGLIRRLLTYTRPYAAKRNWLLLSVVVRAIQLPCVAWVIGAVINGPIANGEPFSSVLAGALGLLALALAFILLMLIYILTQVTLLSNRLTTLTQELAIRRAAKAANPPAGTTDAVDPGAGESGSSMRLGRSATSTMSSRTSPSMTKP